MAEELAVAAVAVFPILLVGRRRGTGAPLRAAVFILPLLQLRRRVTQSTVCHFMSFACLVSANKCIKMTLTHGRLASCFKGGGGGYTNLQAPAVRWLMLGVGAVPVLCPLQGWLQPMTAAPSLLCCVFTAGMWEFLHGLGLWTDVGLSGLGEPSLEEGLWRFGTSGEKDVCAATPVLEFRCPCWPQLGFGGRSVECWDGRPVGLLGGTDRSVC